LVEYPLPICEGPDSALPTLFTQCPST